MRKAIPLFFLSIATAAALTPSALSVPVVPMPANPLPFERVRGVNLFHLEPNNEFDAYLANPDLVTHLANLAFNTFRLPIEWDDFVDAQGTLDPAIVARSTQGVATLIDRLHAVHTQTGQKIFLILDFHQYKFGRACGGVGIPRGAIDETGLDPTDANCLFKAYDRFWQNNQNAQDRWIEWALAHLAAIEPLLAAHAGWLNIGIEPMNEPQFGLPQGLFPGNNPVSAILGLKRWAESGDPQRQVDTRLIPFYQKFLTTLNLSPFGQHLLQIATFVAEPFVFDHLQLSLGIGALSLNIRIDSRYTGMTQLNVPARWIAAPHHYLGALDPGVLDVLPSTLRETLSRYPNAIFTAQMVRDRIQHTVNRMSEAGMASFFGEWGTQTQLLNTNGTPGGHLTWIRDSQAAMEAASLGGLWWQYRTDPSPAQTGFYLLQPDQSLKCELVQPVFGRCG